MRRALLTEKRSFEAGNERTLQVRWKQSPVPLEKRNYILDSEVPVWEGSSEEGSYVGTSCLMKQQENIWDLPRVQEEKTN